MHAFMLLQNATTLVAIQFLLSDFCTVFGVRKDLSILDSLKTRKTKIQDLPEFVDVDAEFGETSLDELFTESKPKTIIYNLQFAKLFEKTLKETQNKQDSGTVCAQVNQYCCKRLILHTKAILGHIEDRHYAKTSGKTQTHKL